jgi:hypothetical protein
MASTIFGLLRRPIALGLLFLFLASVVAYHPEPSAYQIVVQMVTKTKEISSMTYVMKKKERVKGEFPIQETFVKLNNHPFKLYLKQLSPKEGLEVLYVQGTNNNQACVNTNGFPWVNVNLDPMGNVMRDKQHHTIFESGYAHLMSILEHLGTKYQKEVDKMIQKTGKAEWDGHKCWVVSFTNPYFKYYSHTVKQGENILSIAHKAKLSEYMILEKNPSVKNYFDVKPGQIIQVPNDYSPKLELLIDEVRNIPLVIKVFDDKGLYELYEYSNVVVNPTYTGKDFDKNNGDYGF